MDPKLSQMFWDRALVFSQPFRLRDLVGRDARQERKDAGKRWLEDRIKEGDMKKVKERNQMWYSWIN